ncbi:WcbI family polysaccharide biosynthesis putative acetyltransferase [Shimia sp.]|uniref:WcbI family polysaccharide biosynthesis putative acetyltransferase n=1 Tax=Shimia sp. TaxID=1954381 RepID=UPI003563B807
MSILFLGNCQVNAMRGISREMFPEMQVKFRTITPYWGKFDEAPTRQELAEADLVIAQAIENPGTTFNRQDVMDTATGDVIFVPYVYIDGLASLEIVASKGRSVIKGAELILEGQEGRKPVQIFEDYCRGRIDMQNQARIDMSLAKMAEKEAQGCDLKISDYIAETYRERPSFFGINHPAQHIVFELFRRLCGELDLKFDPGIMNDPVAWGRRALPSSQRAFTPVDAEVLGTKYDCDPQWYGQGYKLLNLAIKARERGDI